MVNVENCQFLKEYCEFLSVFWQKWKQSVCSITLLYSSTFYSLFPPFFVLEIFKFKYDKVFVRHSSSISKFEWFEQLCSAIVTWLLLIFPKQCDCWGLFQCLTFLYHIYFLSSNAHAHSKATVNWLFGSCQFCHKKWGGQVGRWKQKSSDFLKKIYAYCQLVT